LVQTAQRPIIKRVAFPLIGDGTGTGAYNYLLNLVRALGVHAPNHATPVLFVGTDVIESQISAFSNIRGVKVVRVRTFDADRRLKRLARAVLLGIDQEAADCFMQHDIDVVFESAMFFGKRFPIPVIAWLPDFQHRHLTYLFSTHSYWKRELGFRAQISAGRTLMLSSGDSRDDCERFYPKSKGLTCVVRFAVSIDPELLSFDPAAIISEHRLPQNFFYLPNQFWKHKNHRVVIDAVAALKRAGREVVVAASGKPKDPRHPKHYDSLRTLVAEQGLNENFRFLGLIPRLHVIALMRACTAMINPSLFEGWSTPVEEAKTLGVPMLLSNLRVHIEQAGGIAQFFEPHSYEQLATLLQEQEQVLPARRGSENVALKQAEGHVREFCMDFLATIQHAIESFGK
jgi:glycosyltransferase involved in cell wall biosynthesis